MNNKNFFKVKNESSLEKIVKENSEKIIYLFFINDLKNSSNNNIINNSKKKIANAYQESFVVFIDIKNFNNQKSLFIKNDVDLSDNLPLLIIYYDLCIVKIFHKIDIDLLLHKIIEPIIMIKNIDVVNDDQIKIKEKTLETKNIVNENVCELIHGKIVCENKKLPNSSSYKEILSEIDKDKNLSDNISFEEVQKIISQKNIKYDKLFNDDN